VGRPTIREQDVVHAHRLWIPALALLFCIAGVIGLYLPILHAATTESLGNVSATLRVTDIPGGQTFVILFLVLSALPAIELVRRRLRLTIALLVPSGFGLLAMLLAAQLVETYVGVIRQYGGLQADGGPLTLELDSGAYVLLLADAGILVAGVLSATMGVRRLPAPPAQWAAPQPGPWPAPPPGQWPGQPSGQWPNQPPGQWSGQQPGQWY
jgi:hypothetical protein